MKLGTRVQDPLTGAIGVVASRRGFLFECRVPGTKQTFRIQKRTVIKRLALPAGTLVWLIRKRPKSGSWFRLRGIVTRTRPIRVRVDHPEEPNWHGLETGVRATQIRVRDDA